MAMTEHATAQPTDQQGALPVGRLLRGGSGLGLVYAFISVLTTSGGRSILSVLGWTVGLVLLYSLMHRVVVAQFRNLHRWVGAVLALAPLVAVFLLGGAGGQLGATLFLGASLLVASVCADPGCEVMSIPGIVLGRRTHLVCLFFSPIDWVEKRLSRKS